MLNTLNNNYVNRRKNYQPILVRANKTEHEGIDYLCNLMKN